MINKIKWWFITKILRKPVIKGLKISLSADYSVRAYGYKDRRGIVNYIHFEKCE
jgi:hypothetical protein